jgi:hypothetical protein
MPFFHVLILQFLTFCACGQVTLLSPVLNEEELEILKADDVLNAKTLPIFFDIGKGIPGALQTALDSLCKAADDAVRGGSQLLILSDRSNHLVRTVLPYFIDSFKPVVNLIICILFLLKNAMQSRTCSYSN